MDLHLILCLCFCLRGWIISLPSFILVLNTHLSYPSVALPMVLSYDTLAYIAHIIPFKRVEEILDEDSPRSYFDETKFDMPLLLALLNCISQSFRDMINDFVKLRDSKFIFISFEFQNSRNDGYQFCISVFFLSNQRETSVFLFKFLAGEFQEVFMFCDNFLSIFFRNSSITNFLKDCLISNHIFHLIFENLLFFKIYRLKEKNSHGSKIYPIGGPILQIFQTKKLPQRINFEGKNKILPLGEKIISSYIIKIKKMKFYSAVLIISSFLEKINFRVYIHYILSKCHLQSSDIPGYKGTLGTRESILFMVKPPRQENFPNIPDSSLSSTWNPQFTSSILHTTHFLKFSHYLFCTRFLRLEKLHWHSLQVRTSTVSFEEECLQIFSAYTSLLLHSTLDFPGICCYSNHSPKFIQPSIDAQCLLAGCCLSNEGNQKFSSLVFSVINSSCLMSYFQHKRRRSTINLKKHFLGFDFLSFREYNHVLSSCSYISEIKESRRYTHIAKNIP
ncbi:hypothetical protein VP01_449g1 [Puccinia sorghi]|uniref:Uncharacterized protein n=1 Tax=Puccinia sorghi TaxID=27349 RepID=A0A0L6UR54_9BASI|nr:hypothetical protein VP01_449g1 [Puccinia sorghi]